MKIQIKSDLHQEDVYGKTILVTAEVSPLWVHPEADVLVLAGDIINANDHQINCLINDLKDVKIPILYVPGNHEYWHSDRTTAETLLWERLKDTNITHFDKSYKIIKIGNEEVMFIGCTLWSPIIGPFAANLAETTPDFRLVKGVSVDSWNRSFEGDLDFLERTIRHPDYTTMKKVVITHHLPSFKSVPDRYKDHLLNCIFASNSDYLMEELCSPDLWIHGHTHDSKDYNIDETRVVCNPRGHSGRDRNPNYDNQLIIEI